MSESKKNNHWFRRGVILSVAAGSLYVIANKKMRNKVGECATNTKHLIHVVNENRGPFIEKLKSSTEKITTIVEDASEDVEKLIESSQHMKDHTMEIVKTVKEAKSEFQSLTKKLKGVEELPPEEVLPSSNSSN